MQGSSARFGLTDDEWREAKEQLRSAILEAAVDRQMTSYGQIAPKVTTVRVEAFSPLMNHLLGEIFSDELASGRPPLTAIVTHKDGDKEPGRGFYDMARKLGERFTEPFVYWSTAVQDVFKLYGRPPRPRRTRPASNPE